MADDPVLAVGGGTLSCNPSATKAIAVEWTTAFPDWKFELLALLADRDFVIAHMPYQGTFTNSLFGITPTGRFARVDEMVIFRIAHAKIAQAREVYDEAGMWRQLGVTPPG